MAKKKQPYIPLYTGDYIKDTRTLSLEAKGAWSDLILFMWVGEAKGVLEGDVKDFARMVGTSEVIFVDVLNELCRKKICDIEGDQSGIFKIKCRRLVREAEISVKRSDAVQTRYKTSTNDTTKTVQKSDNDNDIDNAIESKDFKYELLQIENKVQDVDQRFTEIFDELYLDQAVRPAFRGIDLSDQVIKFKAKVRGSPEEYKLDDTTRMRNAFLYQLRQAKPDKPSKNGISKDKLEQFRKR
jgi:uncharacterized protein YdaU (DUF1376 family)